MVDIVNSLPNTSHLSPAMPSELPASPVLLSAGLVVTSNHDVVHKSTSPLDDDVQLTESALVESLPVATVSTDCNSPTSDDGAHGKRLKRHRRNGRAGAHHRRTVKRRYTNPANPSICEQRRRTRNFAKKVRTTDFSVSRNGRPMAPYNTTQFIMEQNYIQLGSPRVLHHSCSDELERMPVDQEWMSGASSDTSADCYSDNGPSMSSMITPPTNDTMERGYDQMYDDVINERLTCMTKEDLVKECKELDAKNTKLERVLSVTTKSPDVSLSE